MSDSYIAALLDELDGLKRAGKTERAAAVVAELARCGYGVTTDVLPDEVETADVAGAPERATVAKRNRRA